MRRLSFAAALVLALLALVLAGCGGDDDEPADAEQPPAAETDTGDAATETEAEGEGEAEGEAIFVANCGGCHTLSAAGTTGQVGPSFDDFAPEAESVETQVRQGGGGMPAFEGRLTDEEIQAVSQYVAENAGG